LVKEKMVFVQMIETRLGISLLGKDSFTILDTMELFDSNMEPRHGILCLWCDGKWPWV